MNPDHAGVIDITRATGPVRDVADWIVIGTGAAGGVAAQVLAEAGHDVVMVEEGPVVGRDELRRDVLSAFSNLWRDAGFQVAEGRSFLPILQGRAVGGSTIVNGAIVHRIPEPIHALWARDFGADHMLSMDALTRAYDALDAELSVAPGPEAILGGNNNALRRGCDAMGIRSNVIRRNVLNCEGSCGCLQGCAGGRKQSTDVVAIPRALARGARLYATCRAERLVENRGRVTGVSGTFVDPHSGRRGPRVELEARRGVLLAASAIQTPILLARNGIGRTSGLVGRRFQCHPGAGLVAVFDEPVKIWFGATQGYETTEWWDERMKMEAVGFPPEVGVPRLPGFGADLMRRASEYGHVASAGVQIRARGMGRVTRGLTGRTVIRWDYTPEDIRTLKLGLQRLAEIFFAAGAKRIYPGIHGIPDAIESPAALLALDDLPDDPRLFHGIASHLFGTAVMGEDAASSVVAPTLQCHEAPGLYVIDSSVFPTNMGVNPAHTISAVARVTAERLADASPSPPR